MNEERHLRRTFWLYGEADWISMSLGQPSPQNVPEGWTVMSGYLIALNGGCPGAAPAPSLGPVRTESSSPCGYPLSLDNGMSMSLQ